MLVDITEDEYVYNYYPNEEEEHGTVSINHKTGELKKIKISKIDKNQEFLLMAFSGLRSMRKNGEFFK